MQNKLIILGGIILLASIGLVIMDNVGGTSETQIDQSSNSPKVKEIANQINAFEQKSWDKNAYNDLKFIIASSKTNQLIEASDQKLLKNKLEQAYIHTLNVEINKFFSKCSGKLSPIEAELNALKTTTIYTTDVNDALSKIVTYKNCLNINSRLSVITTKEFDSNTFNTMINLVNSISAKTYLKNCSNIQNSKSNALQILKEYKAKVDEFDAGYSSCVDYADYEYYFKKILETQGLSQCVN